MTLSTSLSGLPQLSPGFTVLPQKPQAAPSLFKKGLWDAQVPLNSPFFFRRILTDIKTKNNAINPMPNNTVAMINSLCCYKTNE